jgi:hypothetical protein
MSDFFPNLSSDLLKKGKRGQDGRKGGLKLNKSYTFQGLYFGGEAGNPFVVLAFQVFKVTIVHF